jgi:hypothetical protein
VSAETRKDDGAKGADNEGQQGEQQQQRRPRGVAFQLTVLEPLDINVTHALLSLTQNEALVTDLLANRTSKTAPYIVRNRTGDRIEVRVWLFSSFWLRRSWPFFAHKESQPPASPTHTHAGVVSP